VSGVALTSLVRLRQNEVVIDARTSPLNIWVIYNWLITHHNMVSVAFKVFHVVLYGK
jgi:hypothetical protein